MNRQVIYIQHKRVPLRYLFVMQLRGVHTVLYYKSGTKFQELAYTQECKKLTGSKYYIQSQNKIVIKKQIRIGIEIIEHFLSLH